MELHDFNSLESGWPGTFEQGSLLAVDGPPQGPPPSGGEAFARDIREGLTRQPKRIGSKYLYDGRGSRLYEQILELEEYYPARCEGEILEDCCGPLAEIFGEEPFRLVELGPGDGRKTEIVLRRFLDRGLDFDYVPIDICRETLVGLAERLRRKMPALSPRFHGIVAEYFDALRLLRRKNVCRSVVFFLGSNLGNFEPAEAQHFLWLLRGVLRSGDHLLLGLDLKKDVNLLVQAYNDRQGLTREFNFNLLDRINRELGGHFERSRFMHYAPYNPQQGRMESWLVSREQQEISIERLGQSFAFHAWEGIHVENSHKYALPEIEAMAEVAGFQIVTHFLDQRRFFVDSLWEVR